MNCFCTIITSDYFPFAKVLFNSIKNFLPEINYQLLVVDKDDLTSDGFNIISLNDIIKTYPSDFKKIKKYEIDPVSNLRWAIKPLFLKYILLKRNAQNVIYVDPDIHFFNDPSFLFKELILNDVLLTPHWRSIHPLKDKTNFDLLFSGGIYNAGFFACNKNAINILDWWLEACAYKMEKRNGFYDDQAYLNLMPVYFPSQVKVIEHKGCNVSSWNILECKRTKKNEEEVLINEKYPIIFVHFTKGTLSSIKSEVDYMLLPFLNKYKTELIANSVSLDLFVEKKEPTKKRYFSFLKIRK